MTDAGYVIGGWSLTAAVLAGYTARLWARTRRARQGLPEHRPSNSSAGREQPEWR